MSGKDIYFKSDIASGLQSVAVASKGGTLLLQESDDPHMQRLAAAYRQGVQNALVSAGLVFGLTPISVDAVYGFEEVLPRAPSTHKEGIPK